MFVVMNRIPVKPEYADAFMERFQDRASLVDNMPGFVSFTLLKPISEEDPFVVETWWESKAHYEGWTQSEEFKQGHPRGAIARVTLSSAIPNSNISRWYRRQNGAKFCNSDELMVCGFARLG